MSPAIREAILVGLDSRIADLEDAEAAEEALIARKIAAGAVADGDHYWQRRHQIREHLTAIRAARIETARELATEGQEGRP